MSLLPPRPRGVRKHWKLVLPSLPEVGELLRNSVHMCNPAWGDPIEAQEWRFRGSLKKVVALYAGGQHLSLTYGKTHRSYTLSKLKVPLS